MNVNDDREEQLLYLPEFCKKLHFFRRRDRDFPS